MKKFIIYHVCEHRKNTFTIVQTPLHIYIANVRIKSKLDLSLIRDTFIAIEYFYFSTPISYYACLTY